MTASSARKLIALDDDNLSPAISWLDDSRFFYTAKDATWAPLRIYLYDLTTAKSEQISSPPLNIFGDFAIMLSPDKHWLAVMRAEGYMGHKLLMYDLKAKSFIETPVTANEQRLNISFSDDSQQVYFIDNNGYLTAYHIANKTSETLSERPYLGYWPLKVPGKEQFVLQQDWGLSSLTTQIVQYGNPLNGGDGKMSLVVNNGLSIRSIESIGEGGLIFAAIKPNFHIELWRHQNHKTYKLEQFNEKPEYRYPLSLDWLKGSNKALLSINNSCRLIDVDNGKDTPLCPAEKPVYGATFNASGSEIYLATQNGDNAMAVKMGETGYPYEPIKAMTGASVVKQGHDGQIYYRKDPGFDIYRYDPVTEASHLVIDRTYLNHGYSTNDFVVVEQGIYFMDRKPGKRNAVYFYNFTTEIITHLINSPNEYPNIALSADQSFIYQIQSIDNDSQLLLVEKN